MARDPQRIEKVLSAIRGKWHQYPDLRLGQLLINTIPISQDLFYVEDEDLVGHVEKYPTKID